MTTTLNLRDVDDERQALFDALVDVSEGDKIEVTAGDDVDVHLVRYQLDRGRELGWAYEDPDAEPRRLRVVDAGERADGERPSIDVRDLKPQRRHEVLLGLFDELAADEGFVLVNDHDPKPLYHELQSMHGEVVDWTYRSEGDGEWRVEVTKTCASTSGDDDVVTRYDVREIPKPERHPTIHHRYGMLPEGATMELVAPHEPRPLRGEFDQKYGDTFEWTVVEQKPGKCRVHVTKLSGREAGDNEGATDSSSPETAGSGSKDVEVVEELDVRDRPPAQRHEAIFEAYDHLDSGEGFVLVNDHDPKPLYHQFEAETGVEFHWEYRLQEPGEFRVLVGKTSAADVAGAGEPEAPF